MQKAKNPRKAKNVYLDTERDQWTARTVFIDGIGRKRVLKRRCQSYKEAVEAAKELREEAKRLKQAGVTSGRLTLNAFLEKWLELDVKDRVSPRTFSDYSELMTRHVRPTIGTRRLDAIKQLEIKTFYASLREAGQSPRVVRYVHAVLRSAFKAAVTMKYIPESPMTGITPPKQTKPERPMFTPDDVRAFLEAAQDDRHFVLYLFAVETGCRPEEYLGLQWSDINFETRHVSIQRVLCWKRKKGSAEELGWYFAEPKTAGSRRHIELTSSILAELKKQRVAQRKQRLAIGEDWKDFDLVFCAETGGPLLPQNLNRRHFKTILKKAGLPATLRTYDLRHASATLMLASGQNPKVVAERLGHASIRLTMDTYSHIIPTLKTNATEQMERLLYPKAAK